MSWMPHIDMRCVTELQYARWIVRVILHLRKILELSVGTITITNALTRCALLTRLAFRCHLWIIDRYAVAEYADKFVLLQRSLLCVKKALLALLIPNPIVFSVAEIAHSQYRAEWLLSEQYDCTMWFYDAIILLP